MAADEHDKPRVTAEIAKTAEKNSGFSAIFAFSAVKQQVF
jgi:hypothetical protein